MKILVAGATGAVGRSLVSCLVSSGHSVTASTRSPEKFELLRAQGAQPVVLDGLDKDGVISVVMAARPEVIVHEMTSLAGVRSLRRFDAHFAMTNRLRTEGTSHLLAAARFAATRVFVAQSYTGWPNARDGARVKTEDDPLDPHPPKSMTHSLTAIRALEDMVSSSPFLTGVVVRYGSLYGPGTSLSRGGEIVELVRRNRLPIVAGGCGVWSFVHVDDAARATKMAIEQAVPGIFNVVDDEPAEVAVWLPDLARAIGAPPPRDVPAWLGRLAIGDAGVSMMTRIRGSSNLKARNSWGWQPEYASWRDGFRRGLS